MNLPPAFLDSRTAQTDTRSRVSNRLGVHAQRYSILAFAQLAVGAAAIFARFALSGASPLAVSAGRLALAAAILWVVAALKPRRGSAVQQARDDKVAPAHGGLFAIAGIALALHFAAWISSLNYTSVATSTLLVATTPVWTALYDSIFRARRLSWIAWAAIAAGALGVFFVAGFSSVRPPIPGHEILGDLLALVGALAIGAYFLIVREVRALYGTREIVTRTYSWAAIVLVVAAIAARSPLPPITDGTAWGGIVAMALVSQLLGHTLMNAALRWFSASAVAFTTLVEPVVAAVLAFFVFSEALGPVAIGGALLLLGAIAVFLREEQRQLAV